jgi:hypothetical protein
MTLIRVKEPFFVVPQVGHPDGDEHALTSTNNKARRKSGVLKRIDFLLATFLSAAVQDVRAVSPDRATLLLGI